MIYFTYILKLVRGDGWYQPQALSSFTGGWLQVDSITYMGISNTSLVATFSGKVISDHSIVEITEADFFEALKLVGFNSPVVSKGTVIDSNPPYQEKRGKDYVGILETEVTKTKPELIKPV